MRMGVRAKECYRYDEYIRHYKELHPQVPDCIWEYFDWDNKIWDEFRDSVIYWDTEHDKKMMLDDIQYEFPLWKNKIKEFWLGHPCKNLFYIVVSQKTDSFCPQK
jgi:hypothetical protein